MPAGSRNLLGLGLRYFIKVPRPPNDLDATIKRLHRDVRRIAFWKSNPPESAEDKGYIPGLYFKSDWDAPETIPSIENTLNEFKRRLRYHQARYDRPILSNLTWRQWRTAKYLRNNNNFIVVEGDKNVGCCVQDSPIHNTKGVSEHLGDKTVYCPLTKAQAFNKYWALRYQVIAWLSRHQDSSLSPAEWNYLYEAILRYPDKLARFRMTLKAHKTPYKMRPIVCCAGTFINCLSKWLDHWLQKLKHLCPTYIKDSTSLLDRLDELGELPPNTKLFTADAVSMYTNIDTDHAIEVIGKWLDKLELDGHLPEGFPLAAIKEAMVLVMKNNIFEWGDCYFLQLLGTAMGTSAACMWATIYFAIHEIDKLLPNYGGYLLIFKRFIGDMFGIWVCDDRATWNRFKSDTNDFGVLRWEFDEPSTSVVFLDLNIRIECNAIKTSTHQKPINLYQYIPPSSAHSPGMMRGIIFSLMKNYKRQNSKQRDYEDMVIKLFHHHVARGWAPSTMKQVIMDAHRKLSSHQASPAPASFPAPLSNKERLFLHFQFHPNDIPRNVIRAIYDDTCHEKFFWLLGIKQATVAYSRPKNIQESLTRAKLHQAPGKPASKYYLGELVNN
ncbi:hypothetical protein ACHAWF_008298 [Thalassiosira exigua]